jgi:hypothetical protein
MMTPSSIASINLLPQDEKKGIYTRFIPRVLFELFEITPDLEDADGNTLLDLRCELGSTDVVLALRHMQGARDPLLYAHLTDTINGQIHMLLYIVNDPDSPRFDVDIMPDGTPTQFGSFLRNLPAEILALEAGLAPGQVRSGLRILRHSIESFEHFVSSIHHQIYFIEPLHYHNAIIFERYGFAYQQGRKLMERIHAGFQPGGDLIERMDDSTPFRRRGMEASIKGRSWALHDGILGAPFGKVTMYKRAGASAGISTFPGSEW